MFSQTFPDDCPIRVRSKTAEESAHKRRMLPLTLAKPWLGGTTAAAAMATTNHHNNVAAAGRPGGKLASHNNTAGAALPSDGPPANKDEVRPMPYNDYNPIVVRQVQTDEALPIHYWFYIYLYSSDVDKLLTPFMKMVDSFGADRRLTVIMNRCGVQILLKELELYKSLPRRIVVIKAAQWTSIVKALLEMEQRLPDLMRFATYPLLLDTDTTKYACTKFDRTACNNRLTKPIH